MYNINLRFRRGKRVDQYIDFFMNHWMLSGLFVVALVTYISFEFQLAQGGSHGIDSTKAVGIMNKSKSIVVDLRPSGDFKKSHILNATNLPLENLDEKVKKLKKANHQNLILVCQTGLVAPGQLKKFEEHNFENVYFIKGGFEAWRSANLPVVGA